MSLNDPTTKMSKSHANANSRILLTDSEDVIRSKIKAAVTDSEGPASYNPSERPGVSNLIDILYHCKKGEGHASPKDFAGALGNPSMRELKDEVADAVNATVKPIRVRYKEFVSDEKLLRDVAIEGADRASRSAATTIVRVKKAMGLL